MNVNEMNPLPVCAAPSTINGNNKTNDTGSTTTAEDILNRHETAETKLLSNEQLKRYVLLQQINVLRLKRIKLERELRSGPVELSTSFDFIDWEGINPSDFAL